MRSKTPATPTAATISPKVMNLFFLIHILLTALHILGALIFSALPSIIKASEQIER